ncbi:MAG: hypothetical protein LC803_09325 [Acidobacteria bacterium]|nr:hypothetical protein [Acidobacteriota bacterium]
MPNRFTPINPGSDLNQIVNQINQNFAKLDNENVTKAFKGPNGGNSQVQGRLPNDLGYGQILYASDGRPAVYMAVDSSGNPIFKVAKTGQDATTAGNDQLIFNSSSNLFKIVLSGQVSLILPSISTGSTGITSSQVSHTLGYSPLVIAFKTVDSIMSPGTITTSLFGTSTTNYGSVGASDMTVTYMSVEDLQATNGFINFSWRVANSSGITLPPATAVVKYYVLTETAT